ncbi:MAG: glycerol-3-phosphate dehydrogenase [Acidobacteriota bacterium]|jgi:glycerol-3-phosphate dehydrogenase|nr:glycerol-3-phosphate dehydrogenase [Acidobacteriota bacterium]
MDAVIASAAAARPWDLVVVGGGIQGVALTLEAAERGWTTLLVERDDFGGATTANSLRILHGGLRYLRRLDLSRFRESVGERRWFLRNFPDLVSPLPCLMPLYDPPRGGRLRRPAVLRAALAVNDLLSGEREIPGGKILGPAETAALFPGVDRAGLRGGALWHDALIPSPERLIQELLRRAGGSGAWFLDHAEAVELRVEGGRVAGLTIAGRETGERFEARAGAVANCAGPWVRSLARRFDGNDRDIPELFEPLLAFNLLLDREPPSPAALAVAAPGPGAQTWFLVPCDGKLLAGTAYAPAAGESGPDEERVAGFLRDLNAAAPGLGLRPEEVVRVLWGCLPAVSAGSTVPASRPVILDHGRRGGPRGLVSVSGVKLTTAPAVARRALARLAEVPAPPAPVGEAPDVETSSAGYARRFSGAVGEYFLAVQAAAVLELLAPWPGARVLDVGGGHAQLAPPLVARGFEVTVAASAEVCRERLDRALAPGSFAFQVCALDRLPFADRSFDVALAFRLLTHLEGWREQVAELCRVAARAVIVDYPDTRSFNRLSGPLFGWKQAVEGNTRSFLSFAPGEVPAELARHGFGRPVERRQFFIPMVVHRALGRAGISRAAEGASAALGLTRRLGSPVILRTERLEEAA